MKRIEEIFKRDFMQWRIELPVGALQARERGKIEAEGWRILYLFGENSKGPFMDYLARHRKGGAPIHKRIYESGEEEVLPSYMEGSISPAHATKADEERIDQAYYQYNRRVNMLLAMKGFDVPESWMGEEKLEFETQTAKEWNKYFRLINRIRKEIEKRDVSGH